MKYLRRQTRMTRELNQLKAAEAAETRNRYRKAERYAAQFRHHGVPSRAIALIGDDRWCKLADALGEDIPSAACKVLIEEILTADERRTSATMASNASDSPHADRGSLQGAQ